MNRLTGFTVAIITLLGGSTVLLAQTLTAEEIVLRMEAQSFPEESKVDGVMITKDRFGSREMRFSSWAQGTDRSRIEFTSVEERGQKILRVGDNLYVYFPDARRTIRMQGAALREAVMGSDFSYEDMTTGDRGLLEDYSVTLKGKEVIDGRECYVIEMTARGGGVPYYRQDAWVDVELLVTRKVQKYARSGRLLKIMRVKEYTEYGEYLVATHMTMEDVLKKNSSTEFIIREMDLDITFSPTFFSHRELSR